MRWFAACLLALAIGCGSQTPDGLIKAPKGRVASGFDIYFTSNKEDALNRWLDSLDNEVRNAFGDKVKVRLKRLNSRSGYIHTVLEFPETMQAIDIVETLEKTTLWIKDVRIRYIPEDSTEIEKGSH